MREYSDTILRQILNEYRLDIGKQNWKDKEINIFELKAKYGDAFSKTAASKIYDQITKEIDGS